MLPIEKKVKRNDYLHLGKIFIALLKIIILIYDPAPAGMSVSLS